MRAAPLHVASAAVMGEGANSREKQTGGGRPQHNLLPLEAAGPFLHGPRLQDFVLVSGAKPATCNVQTSQHHRQRFPREQAKPSQVLVAPDSRVGQGLPCPVTRSPGSRIQLYGHSLPPAPTRSGRIPGWMLLHTSPQLRSRTGLPAASSSVPGTGQAAAFPCLCLLTPWPRAAAPLRPSSWSSPAPSGSLARSADGCGT